MTIHLGEPEGKEFSYPLQFYWDYITCARVVSVLDRCDVLQNI